MAAVADGQTAAVVPNTAAATSGTAARERSLIARPSWKVCVPIRKLWTLTPSRRRPGEPIAGLPREYEGGGTGRPPRCPRPPPPPDHPYWGRGSQIRHAGDEVSGSPRLRWGHGREGGEQVRGDVRDRHHEPAGPASSLAAARAIRPRRGRRRDHRADLLRCYQLDAGQRERQPPRPPFDRRADAARVRRLRAARAAHAVPAQRVGGFRCGPYLDQPD